MLPLSFPSHGKDLWQKRNNRCDAENLKKVRSVDEPVLQAAVDVSLAFYL